MFGLFKKDEKSETGCTAHHFGEKRDKGRIRITTNYEYVFIETNYYQVCQHEGCTEMKEGWCIEEELPCRMSSTEIMEVVEKGLKEDEGEVDDVYQEGEECGW